MRVRVRLRERVRLRLRVRVIRVRVRVRPIKLGRWACFWKMHSICFGKDVQKKRLGWN